MLRKIVSTIAAAFIVGELLTASANAQHPSLNPPQPYYLPPRMPIYYPPHNATSFSFSRTIPVRQSPLQEKDAISIIENYLNEKQLNWENKVNVGETVADIVINDFPVVGQKTAIEYNCYKTKEALLKKSKKVNWYIWFSKYASEDMLVQDLGREMNNTLQKAGVKNSTMVVAGTGTGVDYLVPKFLQEEDAIEVIGRYLNEHSLKWEKRANAGATTIDIVVGDFPIKGEKTAIEYDRNNKDLLEEEGFFLFVFLDPYRSGQDMVNDLNEVLMAENARYNKK